MANVRMVGRCWFLVLLAVLVVGCSHGSRASKSSLGLPVGSVAPAAVRVVGGSASGRAAVRRILRGFGRSEILRVRIGAESGPGDCHGTTLEVTTTGPVPGSDRGWWEAQVVTGR